MLAMMTRRFFGALLLGVAAWACTVSAAEPGAAASVAPIRFGVTPAIVHDPAVRARASDSPLRSLQSMEENHIRTVLEMSGNNRARAAATLGISSATLWRKLKAMDNRGRMPPDAKSLKA